MYVLDQPMFFTLWFDQSLFFFFLNQDWDMWQLVSREFMSQLPTLDLSLKRGRSAVTVKLSPWPKSEGQLHAPAARAHEEALNGIIKPATPSHSVISNSMFNSSSVPASASILETSDLDLYTKPCITMFVIKCEDPDRYRAHLCLLGFWLSLHVLFVDSSDIPPRFAHC
jgi:hypothetical protein